MLEQPTLRFEDLLFVLGGLVLFLYGMQHIGSSLKSIAGGTLRNVLAKLTKKPILGLFSGAVVTIGLQSSGATTLFLVGLSEAGMLELRQALSVILGADIGTTITVQFVAFNLFAYSPIGLLIGWVWGTFGKTARSRSVGKIVLGAGLLFFGMGIMSSRMAPLGKVPEVADTLASFAQTPWLGILIAAGFTTIVRSSATTIVLALGLAQAGVIGINEALPIILGANIGTCSTAIIATIGSSRKGWRIALAHVFFKVAGVILIYPFLAPAGKAIVAINDSLGGGDARLVANAHTIFNLFVAFFFLPFVGIAASLILRLLPERPKGEGILLFVNPSAEIDPDSALSGIRRELVVVTERLTNMIESTRQAVLELDEVDAEAIRRGEPAFHEHIDNLSEYIFRVRKKPLNPVEQDECDLFLWSVRSLHHCMVIITGPLMEARNRLSTSPSPLPMEAMVSLRAMFHTSLTCVADVREILNGVSSRDRREDIRSGLDEAMALHERRIKRQVSGASETSFIFSETMLSLYSFCNEIESLKEHLKFKQTGEQESKI